VRGSRVTLSDDSVGLLQAGMQVRREGGREGGRVKG